MDLIYTDRALTALYDALNPAGADTDFYLRCAPPGARILDIGCGTGLLTRLFAEHGYAVTGVEPAAAMLAVARANDVGGLVTWIETDARTMDHGHRFDLAVMTGHVFQVFSAEDALRVLSTAFAHLDTGGRLVFDSRNPSRRTWESWTPEHSAHSVTLLDHGTVDIHHRVTSVEGEWIAFESRYHFRAGDITKTSHSRLRFPPRPEIERLLLHAGFSDIDFYGDWNGAAFTPQSAEIIASAHRR